MLQSDSGGEGHLEPLFPLSLIGTAKPAAYPFPAWVLATELVPSRIDAHMLGKDVRAQAKRSAETYNVSEARIGHIAALNPRYGLATDSARSAKLLLSKSGGFAVLPNHTA